MTILGPLELVTGCSRRVDLATTGFGDLTELQLQLELRDDHDRHGGGVGAVLLAADEPVDQLTAWLEAAPSRPLSAPTLPHLARALLARMPATDDGQRRILRTLVEWAVFEAALALAGGGPERALALLAESLSADEHGCSPEEAQGLRQAPRPAYVAIAPDLRVEDVTSGRLQRLVGSWMPRTFRLDGGTRDLAGLAAVAAELDRHIAPYELVLEGCGTFRDLRELAAWLAHLGDDRRLWRLARSLRLVADPLDPGALRRALSQQTWPLPMADSEAPAAVLRPRADGGFVWGLRLRAREGILTAAALAARVRSRARAHGQSAPLALAPHLAVPGRALAQHLRLAWLLALDHAPLLGGPEPVAEVDELPPGPFRPSEHGPVLDVRFGRVALAPLLG